MIILLLDFIIGKIIVILKTELNGLFHENFNAACVPNTNTTRGYNVLIRHDANIKTIILYYIIQ